jgi:hypothetical protein
LYKELAGTVTKNDIHRVIAE